MALSSVSAGSNTSERKQRIDRPLIVSMRAIVAGDQSGVRRDQEIGRQAEAATFGRDRGHGLTAANDPHERSNHAAENEGPYARIEDGAGRLLDTEAPIQALLGVGDQRERQFIGISVEGGGRGMEDDHLCDSGVRDFGMPPSEAGEMQVANGATGKAPELEMRQPPRAWEWGRHAGYGGQLQRVDPGADGDAMALAVVHIHFPLARPTLAWRDTAEAIMNICSVIGEISRA